MLIIKISDGRTYLFQWDRGVKFNLLCGSDTVTEMHFVTPNGIIRREVEGNTVNVPDAALQTAGTLTMYAFLRDASCAITRREVHMQVLARPKPADYIDPAGEEDYIDVIVDRLKKLPEVKGDKGDKGDPGKDGTDATVTKDNVESALGYVPVKDVQVAGTSVLADGVAQVPVASATKAGTIKIANAQTSGVFVDVAGNAYVSLATNGEIDSREGMRKTVTCSNLDYAVKAAMCDGKGAAWTSAEQAAARSRMGLDKGFSLIETFTVDEETGVIERDSEPDGTPYNFVKMKILLTGMNTSGKDVYYEVCTNRFSKPKVAVGRVSGTQPAYNALFEIMCDGCLVIGAADSTPGFNFNMSIMSNTLLMPANTYYWPSGKIEGVILRTQTEGALLAVGTTIRIYGVRA